MDFNFDPATIRLALLDLLIVIISFTVHEWGHAKMADRLGDDLPRSQGRLTLNPIPHIDLLGTIIIPLLGAFGFFGRLGILGWPKPVMTDPRNYKNPNVDQTLVTLAGPVMNLILALVATLIAAGLHTAAPSSIPLLTRVIEINVVLFVFNMLPIPPLDGSKLLMYWGGMSEETYARFAQWGGLLLLFLIYIPRVQQVILFLEGVCMLGFDFIFRILAH